MAERHPHAGRDQPRDEARRHDFGCQGDQQHTAARRRQQREIVRAAAAGSGAGRARPAFRATDRAPRGEARARPAPGRRGCRRRPGQSHLFRAVGDQRRQQAGRSEFSVRRRDRAKPVDRRLIVEQHVAAAVHLQVDEAGSQPCPRRQDANRMVVRQVGRRHQLGDAGAVDDHRATLAHGAAVEHMVRRDRVRRGVAHRVRVTFCRCRGRSMSVPRCRASRIASA